MRKLLFSVCLMGTIILGPLVAASLKGQTDQIGAGRTLQGYSLSADNESVIYADVDKHRPLKIEG